MSYTCDKCGKEGFKSSTNLGAHRKWCKGKPGEKDDTPQPEIAQDEPVSIPLSMCPRDISLLPERQLYLQVAGRRKGDRFIVEEVKMLRR